ncbi:hypothetical protein CEW81_11405 [Kluyvera genomosp. 3]|uniref:NADP-dependent oxidoreductase domain-containing protein n=1 Tax=Kluyvera genomosp. 3 TaxID=2774055 RepID=A0A248KHM7_9ENTR|nr:hypothetical protein CEW81_11405 [Kluyvera genomosp. 3]
MTQYGTFSLGSQFVNRLGYGAMQLAGPGVFGPPKDRHAAISVLREALELGLIISTPAISMARTSPTKSFAKRCIPMLTT